MKQQDKINVKKPENIKQDTQDTLIQEKEPIVEKTSAPKTKDSHQA